MKRPSIHTDNEHSGADRYLITYADLITLLLGLFVILYASSQVDSGKYKEFSAAMTDYFKPSADNKQQRGNKILPGADGIPQPILPKAKEKTIDQINLEVEKSLQQEINDGKVSIQRTPTGIIVNLPEKLLFQSAKSDIQQNAYPVLDSISVILLGINKKITIDGFTDSIPIHTFQYESNWQLSTARALNIGYYILKQGVSERNFSIRGFGANKPSANNNTPEGRAKNRRVEILIEDLPKNVPSTEGYISDSVTVNRQ
ncbi:MAG: OmpA family protein [Ignavibacteriae bacterium]|nr:OmpA family protein [Ignavibacteriota bacterium]